MCFNEGKRAEAKKELMALFKTYPTALEIVLGNKEPNEQQFEELMADAYTPYEESELFYTIFEFFPAIENVFVEWVEKEFKRN